MKPVSLGAVVARLRRYLAREGARLYVSQSRYCIVDACLWEVCSGLDLDDLEGLAREVGVLDDLEVLAREVGALAPTESMRQS